MTYLVYRFGVVEYPFKRDIWVFLFIVACGALFAMGYFFVCRFFLKKTFTMPKMIINPSVFLWISIIISTIIAVPNCVRYTGYWYPPLFSTLSNPGETYLRVTLGIMSSGSINWIAFFDFFPFVIPPILFYQWDRVSVRLRIAGCMISLYYLLIFCSCGRNMPTILFLFSIIISFFVMVCSSLMKSYRIVIRSISIVVTMCLFALFMFKLNLASRTSYTDDVEIQLEDLVFDNNESVESNPNMENSFEEIDNQEIYLQYKDLVISKKQKEECEKIASVFPMYTNPYTKSYVKVDDPIYQAMPESIRFAYVMGSMYLSSSYHVLSIALRMDFQWSYGIGCSDFLLDYFKRFTGIDVKERTYGFRAMQLTQPPIISTYGWSTAYVQLASDFTFPGVILLFCVLGAFTAFVWIEVISTQNVFGVPLVVEIALFCLFVPANCITFCSGGYFTIFFGSVILFLLSLINKKAKAGSSVKKK